MASVIESWHQEAACHGVWPPVDMITAFDQADQLIAEYCDHCPVVLECAEFALTRNAQSLGIWGGVFIPPHSTRAANGVRKLKAKYRRLKERQDAA